MTDRSTHPMPHGRCPKVLTFFPWSLALVVLLPIQTARAAEVLHHQLSVTLDPNGHSLAVRDQLTLPDSLVSPKEQTLDFSLHAGLDAEVLTEGATLTLVTAHVPSHAERELGSSYVPLEYYRLTIPAGGATITLAYAGEIYHPIQVEGEEYSRDFSETPGLVGEAGVFLSASSQWYPRFNDDPMTFQLEVRLPSGWEAVSQGKRTEHGGDEAGTRAIWVETHPQTEVYLIAAQFTEYSRKVAGVEAMAFLRTPDEGLASRYLEATGRYLEMYNRLLGPYPYGKFALVENFWETGYGMPSFTLLGQKIIRFPFILKSSYPHEILHNWWGNGVYVDYTSGNWCEGLTAYLSDYLFKEQLGQGHEYRQQTLQKYSDYAADGRDFPLADFSERRSASTEAVGYGKSMMLWHMMRRRLGDHAFVKGLQQFYEHKLFVRAGFGDLKTAFEAAHGSALDGYFDQWVKRSGAPRLVIQDVRVRPQGKGYQLTATLAQIQEGAPFLIDVPIAVTLEGKARAEMTVVAMKDHQASLDMTFNTRPVRVDVDPEFDVFRVLDRNETPPSLSGVFGAKQAMMVLPSHAPEEILAGYRTIIDHWREGREAQIQVVLDTELKALPADRALWIFGWENQWRGAVEEALIDYDVTISDQGVRVGLAEIPREDHAAILATQNPAHLEFGMGWVAVDNPTAMAGLARKLPHYHKYSYLGFQGDEPTNVAKGRWPVLTSPLTVFLTNEKASKARPSMGQLPSRDALAQLPPVFSQEKMLDTVQTLAGEAFKGRGFGTPELDQAAAYIAGRFKDAGLRPGGDGTNSDGEYSGWYQSWQAEGGDPSQKATLHNVIGIIPGAVPAWAGQSVIIAAHYDHLGLGWPDVRQGNAGKIHPGADDNASGVAVLLELARVLGTDWQPDRTVIFVAFSGEEAGLLGSQHYLQEYAAYPAREAIGMINLDTVGRLGDQKLLVLGAGSAREWVHIFFGAGYVTGVKIESVANDLGSSDQTSFINAGIPAVQLFTGPNEDYHRPTDSAEKIDGEGMSRVAAVVKEMLEYLAGREEPMTSTQSGATSPMAAHAAGGRGRRVSLGTVPDFTFPGPGVLLRGTVAGSPAEAAGLKKGDILVQLDDTPIQDLKALSQTLKKAQAGDHVQVHYIRKRRRKSVDVILKAR